MTGYEALRSSAAWIDLSARGKIRVTGEDRIRLLHALSTNHIENLAPGAGLYTFFLTEKGRVLADAFLYHLGDSLFIDTEPEARQTLLDHLDRYIIADDVVLEDVSESLSSIALEGPASLSLARQVGIPFGSQTFTVEPFHDGFTARVSVTGSDAVRVFLPAGAEAEWITQLSAAGLAAATADEVKAVRLEHAIPRFPEDISERHLAQETQVTQAIHPNKGCYLGQEIVERVRSRGQVHRLLTPVEIVAKVPPAAGSKLALDGLDVGEITSAAYSPARDAVVALAYLRTEALERKTGLTVSGSDVPVQLRLA
jgi:tRNA-modifying protein YgfZ